MAFRFSESTAVAAGTFNTYVINPKWLTEIGLFQEGSKVKMFSDFRRPGIRFSSEQSPLEWEIKPDRVAIKAMRPDDDCGSALATIIENLPWTPLIGVGVNAEFVGTIEDIEKMPEKCRFASCESPSGYEPSQRTMHIGLTRGAHLFNVQLAHHEKVELSINVHTELGDITKPQKEISELAQETCRKFFALRKEATELAKSLFGVELNYGPNSD